MCTVCRSPHRDEIDAALISGTEGTRAIASRFPALHRSPIERHGRVCLRLADPVTRLHSAAQRAELAAVAWTAVERAQEAVDDAEARRDHSGALAALGALSRAVGTAERLYPGTEGFAGDADLRALLVVLADAELDTRSRDLITTGLHDRGAVDLADALTGVWARRPALLATREDTR